MWKNIYYNPEGFGLETVGQMDWSEPNWDFDMLVVWKEKRGRFWIGADSGCSCPTPFEDIKEVDELDGPYTKEDLRKRMDFLIEERTKSGYSYGYPKAELRRKAREILSRA